MRVFDANWMQIEEYLSRDDRIAVPIGSTEQHGYLSLGTDAILAERVAAQAAEPLGVPVLPVLPFGMAPYFAAFPGSREWICQPRPERVQVLFHSWYNAPQTAAAASQYDPDQMHGGWVENFPWTRVAGAEMPAGSRPVIPREQFGLLDAAQVRAAAPDGVMGGAYARPDEDMKVVWDAGVAEVRALLQNGWV